MKKYIVLLLALTVFRYQCMSECVEYVDTIHKNDSLFIVKIVQYNVVVDKGTSSKIVALVMTALFILLSVYYNKRKNRCTNG